MAVHRLEFRILGPLVVRVDGTAVPVGGPKQRALLALLLLSANRVVSRDTLIGELFADLGVNSADHALRNQVSRLRKVVTPEAADEPRLVARAPGYLLRVEPGELDLDRFEELVSEGREALGAGDPATAAVALRAAEALWSGRPLADLEFEPFARVDVERLDELRLAALEDRLDADLALGRHVALVAELEALADEHPYRERFRAQLMLALYRGGRQAEGLEVYRRTRELLNDELGLEPGVQLQHLERAILVQDPALELAANGGPGRAPPRPDVCPFKGLAPFDVDDTEFFFGRERLVEELIARVGESSLLAIVGPSGSGKSSLLRAGLLPALEGEIVLVRPGETDTIAGALDGVAPGGRVVIAVDQFEELFAASLPERERRRVVDALVDAAWDPERRAIVLLALRADFFGRLAPYVALSDLVGPNHVLLGPMTTSELRRAIEGPAERTGLEIEPELVDALVDDVAGEAGSLPLLSTALLDLWRGRNGDTLTLAAYERSGGVRGAVGRHAEAAFLALDETQQPAARRILVRLVAGGDGEPFTRRRVSRDELDPDDGPVLEALVAGRLLVASGEHVEVVHEALLERWPRLADWLDEDAQGRRLHSHLARAASDWEASGRDPGELYRGARLAATAEWADAAGADAGLNRLESEFLVESRTAFARANRRLRTLLAAALVLLVLALAAGAVALAARGSARRQATDAVAERLGAQALVDPELDRSLLLAREGTNLHDSATTESNLLADLLRSPAAIGIARQGSDRLIDEALSPDGRILAVRGDDGAVVFFDARTLRRVGAPAPGNSQIGLMGGNIDGPLHDLAFDGRTLLVGGTTGHTATLLAVDSGHREQPLGSSPSLFMADVAVSPDGNRIATGEPANGFFDGPAPEVVVVRDRSGSELATSTGIAGGRIAGYTHDGRGLVITTGPGRSILLDGRKLERLRTFPVGGVAAVSPTADEAAFGHGDGSVTLLDLRSGATRRFAGRAGGAVDAVAFARDGSTLATATDNGTVATWTVRTGELRDTFTGHSGAAIAAVFSPDGRTLYTASSDGAVIAWDATGARRLGRPFRYASDDASSASAVDPDGSLIAVTRTDDQVSLLDGRSLERSRLTLAAPIGGVHAIAFSQNGALVAATGDRGAAVWNVRTGARTRTVTVGPHGSTDVAFSPDGTRLAVGEADNAIKLVGLRTGATGLLSTHGTPGDVDFSPDGRLLASASLDGTVTIWDVASRRALRKLKGGAVAAFSVAFSPDGKLVAVGDNSGNVVLWDPTRGTRVGSPLVAHNGGVVQVRFSPDGRALATAEFDGNLRLWNVTTRKLIGAPLPSGPGGGSVAFFPDGRQLLGTLGGGTGTVWTIDPRAWESRACSVAGRQLSRAEWADFLGGRGYRDVCPTRASR